MDPEQSATRLNLGSAENRPAGPWQSGSVACSLCHAEKKTPHRLATSHCVIASRGCLAESDLRPKWLRDHAVPMTSGGFAEPSTISRFSPPQHAQSARHRLDAWLSSFQVSDGVSLISEPRAFEDAEEDYEADIGSRTGGSAGVGAYRLWRHMSHRDPGVALEVGAGSGAVTMGFIESADGFLSLVTDPSPAFLKMTERKLLARNLDHGSVRWATLVGEDLAKFPSELFDLVFLEASLYHCVPSEPWSL